jgi:hypothetical protein
MLTFYGWLAALNEERGQAVAPEILRSYDQEVQRQLERMAATIKDPQIRAQFQDLIDCNVMDRQRNCHSFASYLYGALLKNGINNQYDMEMAVQYAFDRMLTPRSETGDARTTLFTDFDPNRADSAEHFRARFMTWVKFAVNNIRRGKIRRLARVEPRPPGTLTIGQGRRQEDEPGGAIAPDKIGARPSTETGWRELTSDIETLLKQKELAYPLPLVDLFHYITSGMTRDQQIAKFGDQNTRIGRQVIIQTIEDYARSTDNYQLLQLVQRWKGIRPGQPGPPRRQVVKPAQPVMDPQEKDYRSIASVVSRYGTVGSSQLGTTRRRWLDYAPRNPASEAKNRLGEVLSNMVRDGVLVANRTAQGAYTYSPGPNFGRYSQAAVG